jgi:O-antigen/teichoic acid export membrane protein
MSQVKQMLNHSLIYAIGNLSRQLVGFLMLPVYTSYLSPSDYGVVGLLIFMVSLIELLFGGHMYHALPKFYFESEDQKYRRDIVSTALVISASISGLAVLISIYFSDITSQLFLGSIDYSLIVSVFSFLILTHALENYGFVFIRILKKPWIFIGFSALKLILQLALNIYLVIFLELGVMGVALSSMISSILISVLLTHYIFRKIGFSFHLDVAKKLVKFSWPLWVSGLAGLYIGSSNRYFLQLFTSLDEVGLFELAAKFGSIISLLIWFPFAQYWQTERFSIYRMKDPIPVFQNTFSIITALLIIVGLGISVLSKEVIVLMASEEFHNAYSAVPYLVFSAIFQNLVIFNNFSFLVTENTVWMSKINYLTALIISIFYLILIPEYGFIGAAQALFLSSFVQFMIVFFLAKKYYNMKLKLSSLFFPMAIAFIGFRISLQVNTDDILLAVLLKLSILLISVLIILFTLLLNSNIRLWFLSIWSNFRKRNS